MARVTEDDVLELMDHIDSDVNLTPFINTANLLVTEELEGKGMSEARLTNIELWLSAHFAAVMATKSGVEDVKDAVSITYQNKVGLNFNNTPYGQQAILLDTSGTLIAIQNKASGNTSSAAQIRLDWAGTDPDD